MHFKTSFFKITFILLYLQHDVTNQRLSRQSHHGRILCSSRKNPYPPQGRSPEIPRGRGVLKVKKKVLEAKYEAKLEIPGGSGVQNKKPSVEGV